MTDEALIQRAARLTPREREVWQAVGEGLRVADIARKLFRSERTIEKHRESIGRKLGIGDRLPLAIAWARHEAMQGRCPCCGRADDPVVSEATERPLADSLRLVTTEGRR